MEVAPLKNLFFLAVLKLDVKDSFGYNKEIDVSFIELNFTVAFLLVIKTWEGQFVVNMGR